MLEITTSTKFVPGTNLKGNVTGANWLFLLPTLTRTHVVCIGQPLLSTLLSLSNFCQYVTVICIDEKQEEEIDLAIEAADLRNVEVMIARHTSVLLLPAQSADLLLISGRNAVAWLTQNSDFCAELFRLLTPDGLIYHEYMGATLPLNRFQSLSTDQMPFDKRKMCRLWLTPLSGEVHTVMPLEDRITALYFRQNQLYSPSVNRQLLRRVMAAVGHSAAGTKDGTTPSSASAGPGANPRQNAALPTQRRVGSAAKQVGNRFLQTLATAEERLSRDRVVGTFFQRFGALYGPSMDELTDNPPSYLRQIARADGVNIDGYRWGLSASGEYSSRKLLFFLFNPVDSDSEPKYIVKMVRDAVYNARLENECRSLRLLRELGVGNHNTLPQVVFAGHHDGLALVAENAVSGLPFRQATRYTADCPYALAAVEWLTNLASKTMNPTARPKDVGAVLRDLFAQFDEIYQLTSDERTFLANQIAQLEQSRRSLPLVFQHGDPGTWNMLATASENVAILDWEAAEPNGMPLWDLFYFLRSYTVGAARAGNSIAGFQQLIFNNTPLRRLFSQATIDYCRQIDLDTNLAEPLFYTCWMHRGLKEATRLPSSRLAQGHYVNLLRSSMTAHVAVHSLFEQAVE